MLGEILQARWNVMCAVVQLCHNANGLKWNRGVGQLFSVGTVSEHQHVGVGVCHRCWHGLTNQSCRAGGPLSARNFCEAQKASINDVHICIQKTQGSLRNQMLWPFQWCSLRLSFSVWSTPNGKPRVAFNSSEKNSYFQVLFLTFAWNKWREKVSGQWYWVRCMGFCHCPSLKCLTRTDANWRSMQLVIAALSSTSPPNTFPQQRRGWRFSICCCSSDKRWFTISCVLR